MQDTSDARVPPYNRCDRNILFDVRNILFDDRNNCLMIAMVITVLTGNLLRSRLPYNSCPICTFSIRRNLYLHLSLVAYML